MLKRNSAARHKEDTLEVRRPGFEKARSLLNNSHAREWEPGRKNEELDYSRKTDKICRQRK